MSINLPNYKEALRMGKDKIKETMAPVKARSAKKKAELEMCKIDEEIADIESKLMDECCKEDVSFEAIIRHSDKIDLLKRRKKQYNQIIEQMFPEE